MIRTSNGSFALKAAIALAAFLGWSPAFAKPAVTVRPIANPPGKIVYPRIVAGASVAVRQKVDKALAEAENADRGQRSDCLAATRQAGEAPDSHSFEETIKASYVSARYLSIDVRQSYFCATAYPTDDAGNPLSFDLVTGAALDWNQLFKPGFVPHDGETEPSTLTRLYQARYAASDEEKDCKDVVSGQDPFNEGALLWLDAAKGGLVVQPNFPHVVAACARPITLRPKELAPYAVPALLRDLQASAAHRVQLK